MAFLIRLVDVYACIYIHVRPYTMDLRLYDAEGEMKAFFGHK
jgi:hypothetical protein